MQRSPEGIGWIEVIDEDRVVLGAFENYEPRCRRCHRPAAAAAPDQPDLPIDGRERAPAPHEQPHLPLAAK
ncbi:MAG: hypothetical protein R3F65_23375 [bacterium]|nr:hypothetical protein [Myxococcales bacterium]